MHALVKVVTIFDFSESKRFLGSYKLNPYRFSTQFKDPDNPEDPGFFLESVKCQISNGPIDNFVLPDLDKNFKGEYLKFQRSLHQLSPTACPNISYDGEKVVGPSLSPLFLIN